MQRRKKGNNVKNKKSTYSEVGSSGKISNPPGGKHFYFKVHFISPAFSKTSTKGWLMTLVEAAVSKSCKKGRRRLLFPSSSNAGFSTKLKNLRCFLHPLVCSHFFLMFLFSLGSDIGLIAEPMPDGKMVPTDLKLHYAHLSIFKFKLNLKIICCCSFFLSWST